MRRMTVLLLCCMLLSSCAPAAPTIQPTQTLPSATVAAPTATMTVAPPPTETPLPTATVTASPTPLPAQISLANAAGLTRARQFGNGRLLKLTWSPDGKTLLALSTTRLMGIAPDSAEPLWETALDGMARDVGYSADGKHIITLSPGGLIVRRDAASGAVQSTAGEVKPNLLYYGISADGSAVILTNFKRQTGIYDTENGMEVYNNQARGMQTKLEGVAVAPDGSWFATSGYDNYQQIQLWETNSGNFLRGLTGIGNDFIHNLTISPDGKYIAGVSRLRVSSTPDISLLIWSSQTGSVVTKIARHTDITAFAFLPDSSGVLLAQDGQIELVTLPDGSNKASFRSHHAEIQALAVSPDGKQLASADAGGTLKIWDVSSRKEVADSDLDPASKVPPSLLLGLNYLYYHSLPAGMAVSSDGALVALPSANRNAVDLLSSATGKLVRSFGRSSGLFTAVALSADGKRLAAVALEPTQKLYVWDIESGRQIKSVATDHNQIVTKMMFSPDGRTVATLAGAGRGELYLWDCESGEKKMTGAGFATMDFTRDSQTLVTDNIDFGLYFWDIAKGRQTSAVSADWVFDIDFSPDEKTIAVAGFEVHKQIEEHTNLVTFLDTTSKTILPMQLLGDQSSILAVRYSPDGALIASMDEYGCLTLWDAAGGEMLAQTSAIAMWPFNMEFLPDGRGIVVGGSDGTLHFFEVR